jgi:hypothetical protein
VTTKPPIRIALFAVLAALLLLVVPPAFAGKGPGGGGGASIKLVLLNSTDGLPHFGQNVTFTISTTATKPWVDLTCYQNGARVLDTWQGFFDGYYWGQVFPLGPTPSWQGGDADCTARLVTFSRSGRESQLASTSFHAYR